MRPDELLTELGYAERLGPLLKYPGQPRQPLGVPTGGQFAGGASGQVCSKPTVVPVFLDTQRQRELEAKTRPFFAPEPYSSAISDGHALDFIAPGGGAPFPMPGLAPKASEDERNREGPSCPPEKKDRPRGPNAATDAWEEFVRKLVNPSRPTQPGNAYYLPDPYYSRSLNEDEAVSFDDCKRTDEKSIIPGLRRGDMLEMKSGMFNFLFSDATKSWSTALEGMSPQIGKQNEALEVEGLERHIVYCFDVEFAAEKARERYGSRYRLSRFLACRFQTGGRV